MNFRIFTLGKEFVGCADVHATPGRHDGHWEDCYPADMEVEVKEIFLKLGSRTKQIEFAELDSKAQDRIISEIEDDYATERKRQYNEDRYDR